MVTMIDPPSGWKYGFPKPIPDEVEDVLEWLVGEGYPQSEIDACGFVIEYNSVLDIVGMD